MKPQAVKGTYDVLPEDVPVWRFLYDTIGTTLERAGVEELVPPIFEATDVFVKSVGESSDIVVQKEMFTFVDRGGRSLTLRPEFTAGVMRAYIEHGMHTRPQPVKLWSRGPVFRAENVQRGRYRQFHQVNCEFLGLANPLIDAEAIALAFRALQALGLQRLELRLGTIGDPEDRRAYNDYLRQQLGPHASKLSKVSQERLKLNPMRILDSKDPGDQALVAELKRPLAFLNDDARAHFEAVQGYLRAWGVPFVVDPAIVRALDYYRRTAFEVHHPDIGAQSSLVGGGRYDGLVESLGGPETPGVGWAIGVERVLDAMRVEGVKVPGRAGPDLYLVPLDDEAVAEVAALAFGLRERFHVQHAYVARNPGKGMREAARAGARFAALRGSRERERGVLAVKNLATGEQHELSPDALADLLAAALADVPAEQPDQPDQGAQESRAGATS